MSQGHEPQLPSGWSHCKLDDIADLIRGIAFPKVAKAQGYEKGLIACLRTTNVQQAVEWDDLWWVPERFVRRDEQIVRPGDVLISVANSHDLVGKVALIVEPPVRSTLGAFIAVIRAIMPVECRFLYYQLASPSVQSAIRSTASTTTNISNVNSTKVRATTLTVAPLHEQQRIAEFLDELLSDLDAGVAALGRVQAKLKHYRAAVLKAAVEGQLTAEWRARNPTTEPASALLARILTERRRRWEESQLQKFKDAGKEPPKNWKEKYQEPTSPDTTGLPSLPEGWCWATCEQMGDVNLGRQRAPQHHTGAFMRPYLRVANVYEDRIDLNSVYEMNFTPAEFALYEVLPGDILLNEGQSLELVGRSAIYRGELPGTCFTNTLIRFRLYAGLMPALAQTYFRACLRNHRFRKLARWTTNIAHLGGERFAAMEFPVPPIAEQEAIVEAVEAQLSVIDHLEADLEAKQKSAQALRQSILRHAFTGQLVPQDPNDEPASELLKRIAAEREERSRLAKAAKSPKSAATSKRGRRKKSAP